MASDQILTAGWSPSKELWEKVTFVGENLSWRRVDMDLNQLHRVPKDRPGVYLRAAPPPTEAMKVLNLYTVLYAGQVKSPHRGLRTRFREHIRQPSPKLKLFVDCYYPTLHFWFSVLQDSSKIDDMEVLLIEAFDPPCNSVKAPKTETILARLGIGKPIRAILRPQSR